MLCSLRLAAVFIGAVALSAAAADSVLDLKGRPVNPFDNPSRVHVLLFVRTDCPITNRYAPELQRIAEKYRSQPVDFWLVYPDASETPSNVESAIRHYAFPGTPVLDIHHVLVKRAQATIAPEAAVFAPEGTLSYHGRIDDRFVDIGKARPEAQEHDLDQAIAAVLAGHTVKQRVTRAVGCYLADVE